MEVKISIVAIGEGKRREEKKRPKRISLSLFLKDIFLLYWGTAD